MIRILCACVVLGFGSLPASAEEFYLRYDGNDFPENEGWERRFSDPGGQIKREIDNGVFRLDTRASTSIYDGYVIQSEALDLLTGEELRMSWRMETIETQTPYWLSDVVVGLTNAEAAYVQLLIAPGFVREGDLPGGDPAHLYLFDVGVPHTFSFVTTDMQEYDLFVDDEFAFHGLFDSSALIGPLHAWFGDGAVGLSSLSQWDWIEIAVVPEPACASLLLFVLVARRILT